ncbi:MAG: amino acid adenylation domain-containing protein [Oscillospiraceae bacterium]|nr:amino acid adenylation domain-containing protein [Oscillospiraceae bacterium]
MQTNVLEYLEQTLPRVPDKTAFADDTVQLSFAQVSQNARAIGSALHRDGLYGEPVVVFMEKSPTAINAFFGVIYAGCYYVPLDVEMPAFRIEMILEQLKPRAVICDAVTQPQLPQFGYTGKTYLFDEVIKTPVNDAALAQIRAKQLDIDPIYIVFTSGSTGVPKGILACHRSVIDYIENLSETLGFNENTVFGNQTPLYFDACLKELYPTLKFGATTWLVPKQCFSFPIQLVEYLNAHKINTICWVVSALTMISATGTFKTVRPETLHTIAFGSEVFPVKQFKRWREVLPEAKFTNLYGPTEATGMSCYYHVDRDFEETDAIPIGKPFRNTGIILLDEHNKEAAYGEPGEICIRGTCLTMGYFGQPDKTAEVFTQNPLQTRFPELIYRTGDIAHYNEDGDLVFVSRKDYQIKHMGHRIELGEIEINCGLYEGVEAVGCIYDKVKGKIVLFYTGNVEKSELAAYLKERLPRYMQPNKIRQLDEMPHTPNGKLDRKALAAIYEGES